MSHGIRDARMAAPATRWRTCPWCKRQFWARHGNMKFCSRHTCRQQAQDAWRKVMP